MNTVTDSDAKLRKLLAETDNLIADTRRQAVEQAKLHAEAMKMQTETRWHPLFIVAGAFAAGAGFFAAVVAAVKALFF